MRVPWIAAALILLALPAAPAARDLAPHTARRLENESDLEARIGRESNPVKKAKYQIRLSRLRLLQAIDAYNKGGLEPGQRLLDAYLEQIRQSWQTLQASERRAVKQPQGFKELDIELREDLRLLDDLAHRLSYMDRDPIEKAGREVERVRGEVLRALFPSEHPAEHPARHPPKSGTGLVGRVESSFRKQSV